MMTLVVEEEENIAIQYDAFLLLSIFILSPVHEDKVFYILKNNRPMLIPFIETFQEERGNLS